MNHDPEKNAAAYLGGYMTRRRRSAFEEHIVECEDCWREIDLGREGRAVAESGRELAPQFLRERIRSSVATMEPRDRRRGRGLRAKRADAPPRRRPLFPVLAAALALLLLVGVTAAVVVLAPREQPRPIAAALADFRDEGPIDANVPAPRQFPKRLGDLQLVSSSRGSAGGLDVVVHSYEDEAGHAVSVYEADETWPVADGARHTDGGRTWVASLGDTVLFCSDAPIPALVVGDDAKEVKLAAEELGLR